MSWAIHHGRLEVARALVEAGTDLERRTGGGMTPLEFAAGLNRWEIAALLRRAGPRDTP